MSLQYTEPTNFDVVPSVIYAKTGGGGTQSPGRGGGNQIPGTGAARPGFKATKKSAKKTAKKAAKKATKKASKKAPKKTATKKKR